MKNPRSKYPCVVLNSVGDALILRGHPLPALFLGADSVRDHLAEPNSVVPHRITSRLAQQLFEMLIVAGATFAEPTSLTAVVADSFSLEFALPNGVRVLYTESEVPDSVVLSREGQYGLVLARGRCFAMIGDSVVNDTLQMFTGISAEDESVHDASGFEYLAVLAATIHHG